MKQVIDQSIEAMLSRLAGGGSERLRRLQLASVDSLSFVDIQRIELAGSPSQRYVLKRFSLATDWIMRATDDRHGRAVVVWQTGLLDQLPADIVHGYVACAREDEGWAILMKDLSEFLIPPGDTPIGVDQNECFLSAMARFHAHFWERADLADETLGFLGLESYYRGLTPATAQREAGDANPIQRAIVEGWQLIPSVVEPDLAAGLQTLTIDPRSLCQALRIFPQTVIHRDWKLGNLGLIPGQSPRVILLDWAVVGASPPLVDLAWYLAVNSARLPVSKEEAIAVYRRSLVSQLGPRFDESWWQPQLDLALLGGFLMLGWSKALGAVTGATAEVRRREQAELIWWSGPVRAGLRRLSLTKH